MDEDDEGFDLIQPSLIQQLRTILDQYPDDGQILKELIQNAEDAGARHVKFLHDKHSYGTERLHSDGLAQFQGPALYAYNSARFTKDDWRGIRMLCDSIKVKDPMKVGRFGLGFKSVFHVTDLPSIFSDTQIGVIDPHEEHFSDRRNRRTGYHWRLQEDREAMDAIPDQFLPYKGIFDTSNDVFTKGCYNGTLFRFPLRAKPSELSQTLYSADKVQTLFESFMADAHLVLLFLQHLESIELYVREENECEPKRIFQVKVASESLQIVQAKRKEFQSKIGNGKLMPEPVTVTFPITVETESLEDVKKRYSFLVSNYFCGGEISSEFKKLVKDEDLSYLPTVGVAMSLPTCSEDNTSLIQGHVFCFLPLPVQKKSLTGLPVHVNGFFALSQNRRYIKTPSADQEDREVAGRHLSDKSLLWNKCLLEEAVPRAYYMLLLKAIYERNFWIPAEAVLRAWPDVENVDPSWKRTLKPLFDLLRHEKILYTRVQGGKWITVEEAIFDKLSDDDPKELIVQVLLDSNRSIVSVPSHVLDAINTYWPASGTDVTSSLMRGALKDSPSCYKNCHPGEKLMLLRFVLKDRNYSELSGLELLPVSGGGFTTFTSSGMSQAAIYIDSSEHPQELLPGMQYQFLDKSIDRDIIKHLDGVAKQGRTQLRHLSKDDVAGLLPRSIPQEWLKSDQALWYPDGSNNDHPPIKWLELLWEYLRKNFTSTGDLRVYENLPLIPVDMTKLPVVLAKLCLPSKIVAKQLNDDHLNDTLVDVLKQLGIVVIEDYPAFLSRHPAVLRNFVHPPSVQGVLKSLSVSSCQMGLGMHSALLLSTASNDGKRALRSFIAKSLTLTHAEKEYLACLPLLETVSKRFVAKQDGLCAAPVETFPIIPKKDLIDIKEGDCKRLARLLDVRELRATEFLREIVFPDVKSGSYSKEEVDKLMAYTIDRYSVYSREDPRFKEELRKLPFVPNNVKRVKASDLFDPRKKTLKELFAEEDVFPKGDFWNESSVLVFLEDIGLKSESHISGQDVFQTAQKIENICFSIAEIKSKALMSYLCRNPSKLHEVVANERLGELLKPVRWLSRLKERPQRFPSNLPLWIEPEKEKHFYKPRELDSSHHINLIGTVRPVIEIDSSSPVAECFGWTLNPDVMLVVEHLQTVTRCYNLEEKPYYMVVVDEIYAFLNKADNADVKQAFETFELVEWVWNGDGFCSPKRVLSGKPPIDLSPYICLLPSEMNKYSTLFSNFGMPAVCDAFLLLQVLGMIKEKYDNGPDLSSSEVKHDLQLAVDILNEVKPVPGQHLPSDLQEMVLIPTVVGGNFVRLEPVDKCMYCEKDWLRMDDWEEEDFFHVHPNIPNSTAELLGVPTLTNRMLDSDELSIGEEFGQEEKLTRRLNRLLEDYTDGFSVPKELIQNADDAGATEVRFLYDERTNEDAKTCLIDEGMRECQGPALWVYNDAQFQDQDFENITKLNGGTKEQDTEKIGRFGLGFNAVYNLTDVPSFVSRNYIVYFDPHTVYLGKAIKDKGKPGIRIDTNKNVKRLRKFSNQFKPFNGVFDCDLHLNKEDNSFEGTLFRFPLRTKEQAIRSEIKQLYYDEKQMRDLLHLFIRGAKCLLLFTQNVFRVSVLSIPNAAVHAEPKLIFQVTKSLNSIVRELPIQVPLAITAKKISSEQQRLLGQSNFLRASTDVANHAKNSGTSSAILIKSSMIVDIKRNVTEHSQNFFEKVTHPKCDSETWLVTSSMGNGQALEFSMKDTSLLPAAGVAVQLLQETCNIVLPTPVVDGDNGGTHQKGSLFCYLPLPIQSGLPVQANGAFAVAASRRHLSFKTQDDKTCIEFDWNNILFEDPICSAYLDLLEDVKALCPPCSDTYRFHSLWPKSCEVEPYCYPLVKSFYRSISSGDCSVFSDGDRWVNINEVVFLDPDLREEPQIGNVSFQVLQIVLKESKAVVDLPRDVFKSFEDCGLKEVIQAQTYTRKTFFHELFFPNISSVPSKLREALTLYALDDKNGEFDDMMKTCACIPSSPFGERLKRPGELVNPSKHAASLFSPDDGRFPFGCKKTFLDSLRVAKLEQLGMLADDLPWDEVAERTESIHRLHSLKTTAALEREKSLINFLRRKLLRNESSQETISESIWERILEAEFLPVLKKPNRFPLVWKSDDVNNAGMLHSPKNVFMENEKYLVCCTELLVSGHIPENVKRFFKLHQKEPTLTHVMCQLNHAISTSVDSHDFAGWDELKEVCRRVYQSLESAMDNDEVQIREYLRGKKFILVGKTFVSANQVALKLNFDCNPYLYQLPEDLAVLYPRLIKVAGVRDVFEENDFVSVLGQLQQKFGKTRIDESALKVVTDLANRLADYLKTHKEDSGTIDEALGIVYLPDSEGVMRPVTDLCINDCLWIKDDIGVHFTHGMIPWPTCVQLGVKTRREVALEDYSFGIAFGQREKLTNRLKRILTGYPCEKDILKELLQNADDAQATEICFIKDPRHHSKERVFEECWKPLQGPALCVYNNKPFTKADIQGIQNLGEGSKGDDPNKTGHYGVGFNAVYHLTDVPSFKSMGKEIGDVLCVFDPHCRYVPRASFKEPGRMFKNTETLKGRFPDVFPCYLEDHFSIANATMFRFPLRTEQMAETSDISSTPVTLEALDVMMKELKKELFEVLLFVNNVLKISLSELDETSGKLVNTYSVEVVMSEKDALERQHFSSHVRRFGKIVKETGNVLPTDIEVKKCCYTMELRDSNDIKEKWLIVQQIGFERPVEKSIAIAYRKHELGMLPRGGVAWLLDRNVDATDSMERQRKVFCFLPLPINTNLPVHINGHFALDHEARRNMWKDDGRGCRSAWNNALLQQVIASCYVTLLDKVRDFLQLPTRHCPSDSSLSCSKSQIMERIARYERVFPPCPSDESHWKTLVVSVYQEVNAKGLRLLPVVRNALVEATPQVATTQRTPTAQIKWFPPTGSGENEAFFNNLEEDESFAQRRRRSGDKANVREEMKRLKTKTALEDILLESGFNLLALSLSVFKALKQSGVEASCVSPTCVMEFYKTCSSSSPLCNLISVPTPVHTTPFKNADGVILVLEYCKEANDFLEKLLGLPLLLTQDNNLRTFESCDPKFLSRYEDILPGSNKDFVHKEVRTTIFSDSSYPTYVFRPLDIEAFAANLKYTLPLEYCGKDGCTEWDPDVRKRIPNLRWIYRVWSFLRQNMRNVLKLEKVSEENMGSRIREILLPLSHWRILPATETSCTTVAPDSHNRQSVPQHFLFPLHLAESVLYLPRADITNYRLEEAVRKLGLAELNMKFLSGSELPSSLELYDNLLRHLVASLKTPGSLLSALQQKLKSYPRSLDGKLNASDCVTVLDFFNRNVKSLKFVDKNILRMLPFYLATDGQLTELGSCRVCFYPESVPKLEMEVLQHKFDTFFLKEIELLTDLYKFLEFESLSEVDVYCNYILKCFSDFSEMTRLAHLTHTRDYLLPILSIRKSTEDDKERLLGILANTPFIPSNGSLRTASCFFDPCNDVFRAMLPDTSFPSPPFDSSGWLPFLKNIGLVHKVSPNHFKKFAMEVECESSLQRSEVTKEKSKVLVTHLFGRDNVAYDGLLQAVCDIRFVASDTLQSELLALGQQYGATENGLVPYTAFKGAVPMNQRAIVWTTARLLPEWADPRSYEHHLHIPPDWKHSYNQYCREVLTCLQVQINPTLDLVISHCQNLCNYLKPDSKVPGKGCVRMKVMKCIYRYLQSNALTDEAKRRLESAPCILVEEGKRCIRPSQAVIQLLKDDEIRPFLYGIPHQLAEFYGFFEYLGCSKSVKATHYVMVLEMLHNQSRKQKLDPNEVFKAEKAFRGLFEKLQETPEETQSLSKLYLPGTFSVSVVTSRSDASVDSRNSISHIPPIPVILHPSTELVFNDAPSYYSRIQEFPHPFILDLKMTKLRLFSAMTNFKDLMMMLPQVVRPQMLSGVVEEKLSDSGNGELIGVGIVTSVKQQFSSAQFFRGIIRLIRHENCTDKDFNESILGNIGEKLRNIEVIGMEKVVTTLFHNEFPIPNSEAEVSHLLEKVLEFGQPKWKVYVAGSQESDSAICLALTDVIVEACGGLIKDTKTVLLEMLRSAPRNIGLFLDTLNIRPNDSEAGERAIFPEPGSFIPETDHHLLNEAFEEFEPGEYVGCELEDQEDDEQPIYIYAVIIEEVTTVDNSPIFTKMYKIDIGHCKGPILANATDLYKFHRVQEITSSALVVSDQQSTFFQTKNKQQVFDEISDILENAWKLPKDTRRKIVKRLFLQWHPDKNPGNEAFCTPICQHIQSETARLDRGEPRRREGRCTGREGHPGSYDDLFESWGARASHHHSQRNSYRENFFRRYGQWESSPRYRSWGGVPPSFATTNPQPRQARRWFRQAEADLQAVENDMLTTRPSYEWACFKCHQAAEKALKSARYVRGADKMNVHNLVANCEGLHDVHLTNLASQLESLVIDSTRMRYPDQMCFPCIPHDEYSFSMAQQALELATNILAKVKSKVD